MLARIGEDRRWLIRWTSALARSGRTVFIQQTAVIPKTVVPSAPPSLGVNAMAKPCRVIAVLGTRPEAIKLALVIQELRRRSTEFETAVVHTGQHRTMLDHVLQHFKIKPDFDLDVMRPNQTLNSLTARVLDTVENACHRFEPNMVLVQGDTTTAFASAMAAYYCRIPVGHIEAGLRSHDIYNPFREEANRRLASVMTEIHFAPTALSRDNLLAEGVPAEKMVFS